MHNVLISNVGFGKANPTALSLLKEHANVIENLESKRFLDEDFLKQNLGNVDIIIAGTEKINEHIIARACNLKLISRVGIGVDNVDLKASQINNVKICYTPDVPALAVPEFTLALILNLLKGIHLSDKNMHLKKWYRPTGRSLANCRVGIIGAGKIGSKVVELILAIAPKTPIAFYDPCVDFILGAKKLSLDALLENSDIISIHAPLCQSTINMISKEKLNRMPMHSYLINTSRGRIIDEQALYYALQENLAGAALDVFAEEPYGGNLCDLDNCILTSHIGAMDLEVRKIMEQQVVEDVINFINEKPLVRAYEY